MRNRTVKSGTGTVWESNDSYFLSFNCFKRFLVVLLFSFGGCLLVWLVVWFGFVVVVC